MLISAPRLIPVSFDHSPFSAARAAATASSMSFSLAIATSAIGAPVDGSTVVKVSEPARNSPPMKLPSGAFSMNPRAASERSAICEVRVVYMAGNLVGMREMRWRLGRFAAGDDGERIRRPAARRGRRSACLCGLLLRALSAQTEHAAEFPLYAGKCPNRATGRFLNPRRGVPSRPRTSRPRRQSTSTQPPPSSTVRRSNAADR